MDLQEFLVFDKAYMIHPIGLSFGLHRRRCDLFYLGIFGDKDSPIRSNGRIIAFEDENLCRDALLRLEVLLPAGVKVKHDYDFICDVSRAIQLIMEEDIDSDAIMLNCINTLLDLVTTSPFDLPTEHRILLSLADRLTFKEEFGEFTQVRASIRNALLWCAGLAVVWGLLVGFPLAWFATRLLQTQLFELTPHDPFTLTLAVASIILVTAVAGYVPARRASRMDPMVALRYE